jgi:hypothetical protein
MNSKIGGNENFFRKKLFSKKIMKQTKKQTEKQTDKQKLVLQKINKFQTIKTYK